MGFGGLGMWEIILIFLVVLLLFGAKRLPEIGSSLGKGIREFKSSVREIEGEFKLPEESEGGTKGARKIEGEKGREVNEPRPATDEGEARASEQPGGEESERMTNSG